MRKLQLCLLSTTIALSGISNTRAQQPELLFAQLAVGGTPDLGIESVVTVTNSGFETFDGTLRFRTENGQIWSPIADGQPVVGGAIDLEVEPFATTSILLTGTELKAGYGILTSDDAEPFLMEGNLTYFVRSQGDIADSIGVGPSVGFYRAAIPFADFSNIALALVSNQATNATVRLKLRNEAGALVETVDLPLPAHAHSSKFLSEIFQARLAGGRVDVEAQALIFGTALTLVSGQISTLPVLPAAVEYDLRVTAEDGTVSLGKLTLLAEGIFVRGFLELISEDGIPFSPHPKTRIAGRLINGDLRLAFYTGGPEFFNEDYYYYVEASSFSFDLESFSATFVETELADYTISTGLFELTRIVQP